MKKIETKHGVLYLERVKTKRNCYRLLDSEQRILWFDDTKKEALKQATLIENCNELGEWLHNFDDVCWGTKEEVKGYAKGYAKDNGHRFDKAWFEANYNRIGDTYILFEYSEAHL